MTDTTNEATDTDQGNGEGQGSQWRKELETRAKTAEAERDQLKRTLAFSSVNGLDLSTNKTHAYFAKTYDGKADADSIKAAAIEAGILEDEQAATAQESVEQETRFNEASKEAPPADVSGTDAEKLLAIKNAKNQKEWAAAVRAAGLMGHG